MISDRCCWWQNSHRSSAKSVPHFFEMNPPFRSTTAWLYMCWLSNDRLRSISQTPDNIRSAVVDTNKSQMNICADRLEFFIHEKIKSSSECCWSTEYKIYRSRTLNREVYSCMSFCTSVFNTNCFPIFIHCELCRIISIELSIAIIFSAETCKATADREGDLFSFVFL